MLVEQRGRLLGELRAQRAALLDQPAHRVGIGDVGGFDRLAGADELAQLPRPRLEVGLLPARRGDLRIDLGELLSRAATYCWSREQIGLGAIGVDLGFGVRHLVAQACDLAGEPIAGRAGLVLLRRLLHPQVSLGDRVGDAGGEIGIGGNEIDADDAGFFHRIDVEPVVIGFQRALFLRHLPDRGRCRTCRAMTCDTDDAAHRRIEFRMIGEFFFLDHFAREIAGQHELDLAGHRFGIDACCGRRRSCRLRRAGTRSRASRAAGAIRSDSAG